MNAGTAPLVSEHGAFSGALRRLPLTRILAAAVLAPLVLICIFQGSPWFEALVAVSAALLAWEWSRLCTVQTLSLLLRFVLLLILLLLVLACVASGLPRTALCVVGAGAAALWLASSGNPWATAGPLYLGLPVVALVWLRDDISDGRALVLWLFAVVWASDIGAYVCGRLVGGPKLAPRISPNKTWSGSIGGLILASLVGSAAMTALALGPWGAAMVASAGVGVAAQAGDLLESWIKRRFGVKDTGHLIPGHGGLLDRVDSLILASLGAAVFVVITGGQGPA